jgi:hypothetical protein
MESTTLQVIAVRQRQQSGYLEASKIGQPYISAGHS